MKFETNTSLSADRLVDIAFPISGDTTALPIHVRTAIDTNFSFGAGNGRGGVIFNGTGSGFTYGADGFVDSGNLDSYTYGHSQKLTGGRSSIPKLQSPK